MIIDVKQYMKDKKYKNITSTLRAVLKKYMGWKSVGGYGHQLTSPSGKCATNGYAFWNTKSVPRAKNGGHYYKQTHYSLPAGKAKEILLDTEQGLLIFDEILAVNIK